MCTSKTLNKAISETASYFKENDRKVCFGDAVMELRGDEEHFMSICDKDVEIEEKLNQKLQATLAFATAKNEPPLADIELSLLCLNGHIAKLEHRRSYLTIALAIFALTLPIWAKRDMPDSLLLIAFTVFVCAIPLWVLIGNLDKRIFLLKRISEHLKFIDDHP